MFLILMIGTVGKFHPMISVTFLKRFAQAVLQRFEAPPFARADYRSRNNAKLMGILYTKTLEDKTFCNSKHTGRSRPLAL